MVEAQKKWRLIEKKSGTKLLLEDGVLFVFEKDSEYYKEFSATATPDVKFLNAKEVQKKFPALKLDNDQLVGIWDLKGGNVLADKALRVFRDESIKIGAKLLYQTKVSKIESTKDGLESITFVNSGETTKIMAKKVVVCCGSGQEQM